MLAAAATKIQAHYKMVQERKRFLAMKFCAGRLQALFRGRVARKRAARRAAAVKVLQKNARAMVQRKRFLEMKKALLQIQALVRAKQAKNRVRDLHRAKLLAENAALAKTLSVMSNSLDNKLAERSASSTRCPPTPITPTPESDEETSSSVRICRSRSRHRICPSSYLTNPIVNDPISGSTTQEIQKHTHNSS